MILPAKSLQSRISQGQPRYALYNIGNRPKKMAALSSRNPMLISDVPDGAGAFHFFMVYCQQGKNMQVLIVFGIIAIIVIAIELSVIAYFAAMFFKQAFKVAQKVEEKEHELDHAIKDTAGFLNHIIGHSINSLIKALDKFLKKRKF